MIVFLSFCYSFDKDTAYYIERFSKPSHRLTMKKFTVRLINQNYLHLQKDINTSILDEFFFEEVTVNGETKYRIKTNNDHYITRRSSRENLIVGTLSKDNINGYWDIVNSEDGIYKIRQGDDCLVELKSYNKFYEFLVHIEKCNNDDSQDFTITRKSNKYENYSSSKTCYNCENDDEMRKRDLIAENSDIAESSDYYESSDVIENGMIVKNSKINEQKMITSANICPISN